jgi:hypothetical protein
MNIDIPRPLLDDIAGGRCLPFVGAGFSVNATLPKQIEMPTWPELRTVLAKTAKVTSDLGGPYVASEYEKKFGRVQLIEEIRRALHVDQAKPGEAHKAFVELPFDTIYTTNFDLLLEDACGETHKPYRSLVGELQMPFHGGPFTSTIVKMHGDLRHEEYIVVTSEDYDAYLSNYPVIATHLSAMLITRTALFMGYSLSDPDFQNIRDIVKSRLGKFQRMAYIIRFNASESDIKAMLKDNLHVIFIPAESKTCRDKTLAELFLDIQKSLDTRGGMQLRAARPEVFEDVAEETLKAMSEVSDASSLLTSSSNLCFVMMPFKPPDAAYRKLIRPAVEQFGLTVLRADEIYSPGSITEQIRTAIQQARLCIADLSDRNPNVLYEVGIAHTSGKPTVLLTKDIEDIPFDLRTIRVIVYDPNSLETARLGLEQAIKAVLGEDRLDEAQRLIASGTYRAAVAILGVLLEHSLRRLLEKYTDDVRKQVSTGRLFGLGQTVSFLTKHEIINFEDGAKLQECVAIRNKAVHDLKEPTVTDARFVLETIRVFIKKYLGE